MRLAVDVMGGDHGPEELLQGVKIGLAADAGIRNLSVVGPEAELRPIADRIGLRDPRFGIHHASEVLTMEDKPVQGLRKKKDCSILRAVDLIKDGRADAVISAGNTGGIVAAATIRLQHLLQHPPLHDGGGHTDNRRRMQNHFEHFARCRALHQ